MKFSIIVCGYNEAKNLDACIGACLAQSYPKEMFEAIYVDNNSTDNSIDIARKYPIQTLTEPQQGPSEARNCGIRASQGEILLFVDSDAVLDKNYLSVCHNIYENKDIGAATGKVLPSARTWISDYLGVSLFEGQPRFNHQKYIRACPSSNLSIRKSVIDEVGNFRQELLSVGGVTRFMEDKELCERIGKAGYKILYDPNMFIIHDNISTFSRLYSVWIKGSLARADMIGEKMKDPFSQIFRFNIPLIYFVILLITFAVRLSSAASYIFFIGLCVSAALAIKSYLDTGMFVQSFFIKPWMDALSAVIINISVLKFRLQRP